MIFTPDLALSEEQFARIGRIHVTWANLEKALQIILTRLALSPDWPAGALTDSLIFESRLKALDALVEIHRHQLGYHFIPKHVCDQVKAFRKVLSDNREMRNRLAHWMIFRSGKDVAAAKLATRLPSKDRTDFVTYRTDDLNAHIEAIMKAAVIAEALLSVLPKLPGPFDDKSKHK